MIWLMGCGTRKHRRGRVSKSFGMQDMHQLAHVQLHKLQHAHTQTHDEKELDKEANEAHDHEAQSCSPQDLEILCSMGIMQRQCSSRMHSDRCKIVN